MAPGLPQTCPDFLSSFPIKTLTFCQSGIKRGPQMAEMSFHGPDRHTQAAQAPAGNICTQITLKICFPIFTPLGGLNGGQMSRIRFFFSSWLFWVSVRKGRDVSTWQGGTEALAKDASERKAAEAGDLLAPGKEKRQLQLKCPFHACSHSSPLEWNCPFPKCTHSRLPPRRCKHNRGCTICGRKL